MFVVVVIHIYKSVNTYNIRHKVNLLCYVLVYKTKHAHLTWLMIEQHAPEPLNCSVSLLTRTLVGRQPEPHVHPGACLAGHGCLVNYNGFLHIPCRDGYYRFSECLPEDTGDGESHLQSHELISLGRRTFISTCLLLVMNVCVLWQIHPCCAHKVK